MGFLKQYKKYAKRYKGDTRGNISMAFGVCIAGVLIASGAAYDIQQLGNAKSIAQLAADNMALAASISVDGDNPDRFQAGVSYTYSQMGGTGEDFTKSMTGKVEYNIDDDNDGVGNLLARATVTGTYTPVFISVLRAKDIDFSVVSDVTYAQKATTPASIMLVLDNSGSMAWDDNDDINKIDGLKTTVQGFMTTLDEITEGQSPRVLRTGMVSYSSAHQAHIVQVCEMRPVWIVDTRGYYTKVRKGRRWQWQWVPGTGHYEDRETCRNELEYITDNNAIFFDNTVPMDWGTVASSNVTAMFAQGGTDPAGALKSAKDWMSTEDAKHVAENGVSDPLKYVIFMTDGDNNSNGITTSSLTRCTQMKNAGVVVYTIGYDLNPGLQYKDGNYTGYNISQNEVNRARSFLSSCATDSDHYILAKNADELDEVFHEISQEIVNEVIRIKS